MPREYIIGSHKAPVWVDCLLAVKCTLYNLTLTCSNVFVGEGKRQVNTHVRANLDFHLISVSVINVLHVAEMSKYGKVAF